MSNHKIWFTILSILCCLLITVAASTVNSESKNEKFPAYSDQQIKAFVEKWGGLINTWLKEPMLDITLSNTSDSDHFKTIGKFHSISPQLKRGSLRMPVKNLPKLNKNSVVRYTFGDDFEIPEVWYFRSNDKDSSRGGLFVGPGQTLSGWFPDSLVVERVDPVGELGLRAITFPQNVYYGASSSESRYIPVGEYKATFYLSANDSIFDIVDSSRTNYNKELTVRADKFVVKNIQIVPEVSQTITGAEFLDHWPLPEFRDGTGKESGAKVMDFQNQHTKRVRPDTLPTGKPYRFPYNNSFGWIGFNEDEQLWIWNDDGFPLTLVRFHDDTNDEDYTIIDSIRCICVIQPVATDTTVIFMQLTDDKLCNYLITFNLNENYSRDTLLYWCNDLHYSNLMLGASVNLDDSLFAIAEYDDSVNDAVQFKTVVVKINQSSQFDTVIVIPDMYQPAFSNDGAELLLTSMKGYTDHTIGIDFVLHVLNIESLQVNRIHLEDKSAMNPIRINKKSPIYFIAFDESEQTNLWMYDESFGFYQLTDSQNSFIVGEFVIRRDSLIYDIGMTSKRTWKPKFVEGKVLLLKDGWPADPAIMEIVKQKQDSVSNIR